MAGIRYVRSDDAARLAAIYAPVVMETAVSFEMEPPSSEEMARRIENVSRTYPWIVFEDGEGSILGYAYAGVHRQRPAYHWSVETTVYLDVDHRGQGLGKTLYTALLDLARDWGYANAYAGVALPNPASEALHASVGFSRIGVFPRVGFKFDKWHDVSWWYRPLTTGEAPRTTNPPR